jgi:alpha-N-arabinofuranosidase
MTLVNLDPKNSIQLQVVLPAEAQGKTASGQVLTSARFNDINTFEQPDKVKTRPFSGATIKDKLLNVDLPCKSVVLIELK